MRYLIELIFSSRAVNAKLIDFQQVRMLDDGSFKLRLAIRLMTR